MKVEFYNPETGELGVLSDFKLPVAPWFKAFTQARCKVDTKSLTMCPICLIWGNNLNIWSSPEVT